ncbi:MAG: outer membrane beta-barrel protein [Ignavibacteriales bacterium]|nr:outer membrane beta-barrel protein [Ignavibacteriales bacterium]
MKYLSRCTVSLMMFFSAASYAQEPGLPAAGGKGLVFSFSGLGNLNLNQFEGGIGAKYAMTDVVMIRGGLQFAIAGRDVPANPPAGQTGTDGSVSANTFGVSGVLEYHLTRTRVSPYIGAGLGISFTSTESKNAVTGATAQTITKNNTAGEAIDGASYFGGMMLNIFTAGGLEYFITNNVSLGAEYRFGYGTTSRYDEETTTGNTTVTTKTGSSSLLGITTGGALAFAVYF